MQVSQRQTSRVHHRCGGNTAADPRVISITKDEIADTVGRLRGWHRRLCDLVDMVTSCYELPMFVIIVHYFANLVFDTYQIIMTTISVPRNFYGITLVIWSVAYACHLILIGVIPSVTISQVSSCNEAIILVDSVL
jgi:hypothetical protein